MGVLPETGGRRGGDYRVIGGEVLDMVDVVARCPRVGKINVVDATEKTQILEINITPNVWKILTPQRVDNNYQN